MKVRRRSSVTLISILVMAILVFSVFTLALQIREGMSVPIIVMQDLTSSSGQSIHSGRPIHAEYVSASSILVGQQIDTIDVRLKKAGLPVGLAEIGIFNTDLSAKRLFATKDVSTLTTAYADYSFSVPVSEQPYTIQSGDRIGVKYGGGSSSVNISIMRDTDPLDPFDGTNTYHTSYSGGWSSATSDDLTMTLKLVNAPSGNAPPSLSVSHSPSNPTSSQTVTFTASATDDDTGLSSIQIFVNGASIGSCTVSGTSASCIKTGGPYAQDSSSSYYATATDILGQIGVSSSSTFSITTQPGPGTFVNTVLEDGLDGPTSMAFAPDGRLFVAEKAGALRVIKNGVLQSAPFLSVPVNTDGERGLIGVAIDPNFQTNKFIYIQYTTSTNPIHNKVSRFTSSTANPDVAATGSETTIIDLDALDGSYHNAGAIHFGTDGKLYIAAGDNGHSSDAQSVSNRLGKILRINSNGTIPSDNPFFNTAGAKKEVWAYGLRNPFTFGFKPGTSIMNINDVGQDTWEEINRGASGANFGWPTCEGTCSQSGFTNPIYAYQHPAGDGRSVAGGAFYEASQFPIEYRGNYYFGDYVGNFIKRITPTNQVIDFLSNTETPVDIDVGADGSLYYLSYDGGSVHKVQYVTTGGNAFPTAVASANPTTGVSPLTVNFGGSASNDPNGDSLTYSWNFGDSTPNEVGVSVVHTYNSPGSYSATLTVNDGRGGTDTDVVSITVGTPPAGTIISPPAGTKYDAGDLLAYNGSASDAQDGTLGPSAFNWKILLHHNVHTHPFQEFNGVKSGSFTLPQLSETSDDVWYRIYLTVTDSTGLQHQTTRDILPNKVTLTLASNVSGLSVNLDGVPKTTPSSIVGVVGISRTLQAPLSQSLTGQTYQFVSWSDGGAATHPIVTPDVNATFTANYVLGAAGPVIQMQDTTTGSGWGIYSTRPVLSEYVSSTSTLVGKQIDSITVNIKKSSSSASGSAQVGIINSDLSMKKVFATLDISTLSAADYVPFEFALPFGDSYTIVAGDRIGVKYTGLEGNHVSIQRDTSASDPFDGANTYLSYYTSSWSAQTTYDLTMTLKWSGGGGGGGGGSNSPPVSDAGLDQSVNESTLVTLTGLGSTDSDGTVASYAWTQTSGPAVSLSSTTVSQPTFTAPSVAPAGAVLVFSLVVTDNQGLADATPDTVQVTVNDVPTANVPPVSDAGPDQSVNENTLVTLTGLGSTDDGTVASYAWNQTSGLAVTLSSTTASQPTFTAPSVTAATPLTFSLVVTDNQGLADATPDTVQVTVNDVPPGGQPPGIVMQDTTTGGTGWGIYSTRPVLSEYVSSSSTLVGKQIDSITVNIKKSEASAVGTAEIGIINPDLSMKKVFATLDISTLTTSYAPKEFVLPTGDDYTLQAGDRIGIKYAGGSGSANYISIMRDTNAVDPFDGANTYLSYYTTTPTGSWTAQTTYDLVMTLKLLP